MTTEELEDRAEELKVVLEQMNIGKVELCRIVKGDQLEIKITEGFTGTGELTFKLGHIICEFIPELPNVWRAKTEKNMFHILLHD